jgi:hypothetical protein
VGFGRLSTKNKMELQDWTARSPYLIPSLPVPTCGSNPASARSRSVAAAAAAAAVVWLVAPLRIGSDGGGEMRSCVAAHSAAAGYHRQQQ